MSNSIWKTGDPVYRDNRFDEIIVREYKRWAGDGVFYLVDDCSELPNRWAYLLDIIAQADKAERLQEALEVAKMSLEDCNKILSADMKDWGYLTAEIALKNIEQLIKE
jgi:hypothetical protein